MRDEHNFYGHEYRRSTERKKYDTEVVFSHKDNIYRGLIKDISLGGAHIDTPSVNHLYMGDIVTVSIPYTSGQNNIKRRGRIVRMNNIGFAIEFIIRH